MSTRILGDLGGQTARVSNGRLYISVKPCRIVDYRVAPALGVVIGKYMSEGWQPYGTPFSCDDGNIRQALVMYEE